MDGQDSLGSDVIEESILGDLCMLSPVQALPPRFAREIERSLVRLLRADGRFFVVDLSRCPGVSSPVLRTLDVIARELARLDGALVLCGLNSQTRETVEWAGFGSTLVIERDVSAAVRTIDAFRHTVRGKVRTSQVDRIERVIELFSMLTPPPFLAAMPQEDDS